MADRSEEELTLNLPWNILDNSKKVSFDIGGSVFKLLYVHKDDWLEPSQRKPESQGKVRMQNIARDELEKALGIIKSSCVYDTSGEDMVEPYTTGLGSQQFYGQLGREIKVKPSILDETSCFVYGLLHLLKNHPTKDVIHEIPQEIIKKASQQAKIFKERVMKYQKNFTSNLELPEDQLDDFTLPQEKVNVSSEQRVFTDVHKDIFPCGMLMCGSAALMVQVAETGKMDFINLTRRAGRMLLGLASLLTGAKSYEELLSMCAAGKANKVNSTIMELKTATCQDNGEEQSNIYSDIDDLEDDTLLFSFGQAVGKSIADFKKEDLARCLLETVINDLMEVMQASARLKKLKHVFLVGGFFNHPLVRYLAAEKWILMDVENIVLSMEKTSLTQIHYLKHGSHLGALGCFLNHTLKFAPKTPEQS